MVRSLSEIRAADTEAAVVPQEYTIRVVGTAAGELVTLFSLVHAISGHDVKSIPVCLITFALVLLPSLAERVFRCRMRTGVYLLCILYVLCSMAGDAYQMYDRVQLWDKLLHTTGGVLFAMFGAYLPCLLNKKDKSGVLLCAVFAVCFSVTISALWEFYEFGVDQLIGLDMQRDTLLTAIDSRLLSSDLNTVGSITNIESVTVNGIELAGYIDIGLIDTMTDMLVETLGALLYAAFYLITKGEYPAFSPAETEGLP